MSILVFDSGVGGLTVLKELRGLLPQQRYIYVADNAAFPYGAWDEQALCAHIVTLFAGLMDEHAPAMAVVACNTASTLVLPALRAQFSIPFVGTVPAIKPAAETTKSGLISVLATPGTVRRDYTKSLIREFAGTCAVTLVGATKLAGIAEAKLAGEAADLSAVAGEVAPAFVEIDGRRTDKVVLACTHYPLLIDELREVAPWPVDFVDPAAAIARRAAHVLAPSIHTDGGADIVQFTDASKVSTKLHGAMADFGLQTAHVD